MGPCPLRGSRGCVLRRGSTKGPPSSSSSARPKRTAGPRPGVVPRKTLGGHDELADCLLPHMRQTRYERSDDTLSEEERSRALNSEPSHVSKVIYM